MNAKEYWNDRYRNGGDSGDGSYGKLAAFKAEIINKFIKDHKIDSIIDYGCGDGNQIKLIDCKKYVGLDISEVIIGFNLYEFKNDKSKQFIVHNPEDEIKGNADLVICLDVLYHILDESEFIKSLKDIFQCSSKYVILYTNILNSDIKTASHIKYRNIFKYLYKVPNFKIIEIIKQKYPEESYSNFIILKKVKNEN